MPTLKRENRCARAGKEGGYGRRQAGEERERERAGGGRKKKERGAPGWPWPTESKMSPHSAVLDDLQIVPINILRRTPQTARQTYVQTAGERGRSLALIPPSLPPSLSLSPLSLRQVNQPAQLDPLTHCARTQRKQTAEAVAAANEGRTVGREGSTNHRGRADGRNDERTDGQKEGREDEGRPSGGDRPRSQDKGDLSGVYTIVQLLIPQ